MTQETRIFPRTVARIASIQAHYQWLMRPEQSLNEVIDDFTLGRISAKDSLYAMGLDEDVLIDRDFFLYLMPLVAQSCHTVEDVTVRFLPSTWLMECMDPVVRALFRCGATEALACLFVPKQVVLNEYMVCARYLLLPHCWGMVNAVLDKVFDVLRPQGAPQTDQTLALATHDLSGDLSLDAADQPSTDVLPTPPPGGA